MSEEWRDVPGYRGQYIVSSEGRVARVQNGRIGHTGYRVAGLRQDGKTILWHIHALVAAAFIGPRPKDHEINHINGKKADERRENLEYVTRSENIRHAVRTGLIPIGGEHHRAKLCEGEIVAIRLMQGICSQSRLAEIYGVTQGTIGGIQRGKIWRQVHVNMPPPEIMKLGQIGRIV